jgi:hypothetical protein
MRAIFGFACGIGGRAATRLRSVSAVRAHLVSKVESGGSARALATRTGADVFPMRGGGGMRISASTCGRGPTVGCVSTLRLPECTAAMTHAAVNVAEAASAPAPTTPAAAIARPPTIRRDRPGGTRPPDDKTPYNAEAATVIRNSNWAAGYDVIAGRAGRTNAMELNPTIPQPHTRDVGTTIGDEG